jgi:hypothetical protein
VKRLAVASGGFAYGLVLTWACLFMLSRLPLHDTGRIATGCHEIGKCPFPWWGWLFMPVYLFGPAILLATINAIAWRKWPVSRWARCCAGLSVAAVALYCIDKLL